MISHLDSKALSEFVNKKALTPLGQHIRELRKKRNITMKDMAQALDVSCAYLSALETGKRGLPSWYMVQKIIDYFQLIWDDADQIEALAKLSHPRLVIDTSELSSEATLLVNQLGANIHQLSRDDCEAMIEFLLDRVRQHA